MPWQRTLTRAFFTYHVKCTKWNRKPRCGHVPTWRTPSPAWHAHPQWFVTAIGCIIVSQVCSSGRQCGSECPARPLSSQPAPASHRPSARGTLHAYMCVCMYVCMHACGHATYHSRRPSSPAVFAVVSPPEACLRSCCLASSGATSPQSARACSGPPPRSSSAAGLQWALPRCAHVRTGV